MNNLKWVTKEEKEARKKENRPPIEIAKEKLKDNTLTVEQRLEIVERFLGLRP